MPFLDKWLRTPVQEQTAGALVPIAPQYVSAMFGQLLDKSSSMLTQRAITIDGFNDYVDCLRPLPGIDLSHYQFDNEIESMFEAVPIQQVPRLTQATYQPRGATHLIEHGVWMIERMEEIHATRSNNPKVVICIQTDGGDSTGQSWDPLRRLITRKIGDGWEFQFLGAGIDPYPMAAKMGVPAESAMSYSFGNARIAFRKSAENAISFVSQRSATAGYSGSDRKLVGDQHAPPRLLLK